MQGGGRGSAVLSGRPATRAIAFALALVQFAYPAFAAAQAIVTDGRTQTAVVTTGNVVNVTTGTVSGANAFNSFSRFGVPQGIVTNLYLPGGTANLINIVRDERTDVYGILNSIKDGRIGGSVWFANPHGFVVGASGVVNVGSLSVTTTTQQFADSFFVAPGSPDEAAVAQLLAGTAPRSGTGLISIQGRVNAADAVSLAAGTVNVGGSIFSGARFVGAAPDFSDVVNANGLSSATNVVVKEGRVSIVADGDVAVSGTIAAPGGSGVRGGDVSVRAGGDVDLRAGALISAKGNGESSGGGSVYVYGGRNAYFRQGAAIDARAGSSGDGGSIELSAGRTVELAGGEFRAGAVQGRAGSILIDPTDITVSANNLSDGADISYVADDTITIASGVTVSSRNLASPLSDNHETANSQGDSGDITLRADRITLEAGSKLLAQGNSGFAGGEVTLEAKSSPAVSILGYRESTSQIQIGDASGGATIRGANVSVLAATDVSTKWTYQTNSGGTWIDDPTDVTTAGRTLALGASTAAEAAVGFLGSLVGVNIVHSQAVGTASVVVKGGSVIEGQNVTLRAENATVAGAAPSSGLNGPGTQVNTPLGLGALYARNKADASVTVESNATIKGQNLTVRAHNDASLEASIASADAGSDSGDIAIAVGVTNADIQSKATIAQGANLKLTGNVSVAATNRSSLGNTVEAQTGDAGKASAAVAVSELSTKATAELNANVKDAARVEVVAVNENTQNVTTANSKTGSTLNDMILAGVQQKMEPLTDPTGSLENYFWDRLLGGQEPDAKVKPKSIPFRIGGAIAYADSQAQANALVGAGASVHATDRAVVVARTVASDIQIAAESAAVSQSRERAAANTARNTFSAGVAIGSFEHDALAKVGKGAVLTAPSIAVNADVSIPVRETLITGGTFDRWDGLGTIKDWFDSVTGMFDVFNGASAAKSTSDNSSNAISLSGSVSILDFRNSARAVVDTNAKLNVSGARTGAWSHSFEVVPDDVSTTGTDEQVLHEWAFAAPAVVNASRDTTLLFHGGHFIPGSTGAGAGGKGLGIAYTQENVSGASEAIVREGAVIQGVDETASAADADGQRTWTVSGARATDEAQVTAEGKDLLISIASAAGYGATFGLNGSASIVGIDNSTRALIDDEASVKADKLRVRATDSPVTWSIAGGFNKTDSAGVGVGISYIGLTANTRAEIADNDSYAGELASRASDAGAAAGGTISTRDMEVEARTGGHVESIAVTGSVAWSSSGQNNDTSSGGFFSSIQSKYQAIQNKLAHLVDLKPASTSKGSGESKGGTSASQPASFGLSGAGSASVNDVEITTQALVDGVAIDQNVGSSAASLLVRGVSDTDVVTASGAAALTRANNPSQNKSAALTGSVAVNLIDSGVNAIVRNTAVTDANDVTVQALAGGEELSIAIGASIDASSTESKSMSVAATGSLSLSLVTNDVVAKLDNAGVTGETSATGRAVDLTAYNRTFIGTGGGSLSVGGKTGAGGAVTYSDITNNVTATITGGSGVSAVDTVAVKAYNATEIGAGAAHGQASNATNGNALGGAVVITEIENRTTASIAGASSVAATGRVEVLAADRGADNALEQIIEPGSERENTVAGLDYCGRSTGVVTAPGGNCITSVAGVVQATVGGGSNNIGLSFNWSSIANSLAAKIEDSAVSATGVSGEVAVKAESNATITGLAVGVGVADKVSAAGSVAVNRIDNNVLASIASTDASKETVAANSVVVQAKDTSRIDTLAGQVTASMNGAAIGAAVTYAEIGNDVKAVADRVNVNAKGSAMLDALADASIRSLAVAGSVVTGGSQPAVSASIAVNFIGNGTEATADGVVFDDPDGGSNTNAVTVKAEDKSTIQSLTGSVSISGTSAAGGGAFAYSSIQNSVLASVEDSAVHRAGTLDVTAKETSTIQAISVAGSGGQTVAISGSVSINHIGKYGESGDPDEDGNVATAEIRNSSADGAATVANVKAEDSSTIESLAGAVAVSIGSAAVGGAVADNATRNVARASVSGSSLQGFSALTVEGRNTSTIKSLSAAGGGAATGAFAGSASSNRTTNRTIAEISASEMTEVSGTNANVAVSALDTATIQSLAGAVAIGGSAAVGAAIAVNRIANVTEARVTGFKPATAGLDVDNLMVKADSNESVETVAVGGSAAADVGVAGSVAVNIIESTTEAHISGGAKVESDRNAGVLAESDDEIEVGAGAVGVGVLAAGVAASVVVNQIGGATKAHISGTGTQVAARAITGTPGLTVASGGLTGAVNLDAGITGSLSAFAPPDLAALRATETARGVVVNASATHQVTSFVANAGAGLVGVSGVANVDVIGGQTRAYIDQAQINQGDNSAATANQGVHVKASDHAYGANFVGSASGGVVGAGVVADVHVFDRDTKAYVQSSTVASLGKTDIAATSSQGMSSLVVGASVGGVGVVGAGGVAKFTSDTEAYAASSGLDAGSLDVKAVHGTRMYLSGGTASGGGVGAGATFDVGLDNSVTKAHIDDSTVTTSGQVSVDAQSASEIREWTVAGSAAGTAAVAGTASVALIGNTTQAYVTGGSIGSSGARASGFSVTATDSVVVQQIAGSAAIGGIGGAGIAAGVTKVENTTSAYVNNASAHTVNDIVVDAQSTRDLSNTVATAGGGIAAGIGGSVGVTLVGTALANTQGGETNANRELNSGGSGTLSQVDSFGGRDTLSFGGNMSSQSDNGYAGAGLSSGELSSLNNAVKLNTTSQVYNTATQSAVSESFNPSTQLTGKTAAIVGGASVLDANRDVKVHASEKDKVRVVTGGGAIGGLAGVGGSVSVADVTNNVEAAILGTTRTRVSGKVEVIAEAGKLEPAARAVYADAVQASGGAVALGAAVAVANATNNARATIGRGTDTGVSSGSGTLTVKATDAADVESRALGATIGLVAAGAVIGRSTKSGSAVARIGNENAPSGSPDTFVDLASGALSVRSERSGLVTSRTTAGAGGVISGSGSDARATDNGASEAFLGNSVDVDGAGAAVNVTASATPQTSARAEGYGGAILASVGVGIAQATAQTTVRASIGQSSDIHAQSLAVKALTLTAAGSPSADTFSEVGGGALLVGVNATESTATANTTTLSSIGSSTVLTIGGDATVQASEDARARSDVRGFTGGIVAAGANIADSVATSDTRATATGVRGSVGGTLTVNATGADDTFAQAVAGTGGIIAGSASSADSVNHSTTYAELGGGTVGSALEAGRMVVNATHTATTNGKVDSLNASLLGASGATTSSDVESTVDAKVSDNARLGATEISVTALNQARKPYLDSAAMPWLYGDGYNASSGSGGLLNGAAASSGVMLDFTTRTTVGAGAAITITGDRDNPKNANFSAINDIVMRDQTRLDAGGAIAVAKAASWLRVNSASATTTLGAAASIDAIGEVNFGARTSADLEANANAKTYGLAGAAEGESIAAINTSNATTIAAGAQIRADRDVHLSAGRDALGAGNNLRAIARTDLYNKTAFPVETDPVANADVYQADTVTVAGASSVRSVQDIYLVSDRGAVVADGQGVGKDLYRELAAEVASAFSNLVGAGDVSLDIRYSHGVASSDANVQVDGTVHAGIQNKQRLIIGSTCTSVLCTPTEQTDGVRFTVTNENLVTNLFTRRENLVALRAVYSQDPLASAAYDAEIAFIDAQLQRLGYTDTSGGVTVPNQSLSADFINTDPIRARGGDVIITAERLKGGGTIKAPNDTEIRIINNSAAFLRTDKLTIEPVGGTILYNGFAVTSNTQIRDRNKAEPYPFGTPPQPGFTLEAAGTSSAVPNVEVRNTFNPFGAGRAPDIEISGDITNFFGTVTVESLKGSVKIQGRPTPPGQPLNPAPSIIGNTINISAGQDIIQSYVDGFSHVGGDPQSLWSSEANAAESARTTTSSSATHNANGSRIAGNNVFLSARYLNINGLVQSGIPDWEVSLGSGLNATMDAFRQDWINRGRPSMDDPVNRSLYRLSGFSGDPQGRIAAFYNPEKDKIELDNVQVQGGYAELFGQILNTGGGRIEVMDGYGRINVANSTNRDVIVNGLDTGGNIHGLINITDSSKQYLGRPVTTSYERIGGVVRVQEIGRQEVTVGGQKVIQSVVLSSNTTGSARTGSYAPLPGLRYVWQRGQDQQATYVGAIDTDSIFWGGINISTSQYDTYTQTAVGGIRALANGEYPRLATTINGSAESANYEYRFNQRDTGAAVFAGRNEWSTCNDFLCFTKTYHLRDVWKQGLQDIHTHSVKADNAIPIRFLGYDTGEVNVTSSNSVVLAAPISNLAGTTSITAARSITSTGDAAAINTPSLTLRAGTGIGDLQPLALDQSMSSASSVDALTTGGAINLKGVRGDLRIAQARVSSVSGDVTLEAESGLLNAVSGSAPLVEGRRVTLVSRSGNIGAAGDPLRIRSQDSVAGGVDASAANDIHLKHTSGNLRLRAVEAGRDVTLEAAGGSIIDGNPQERADERAIDQLTALWNNLRLTGAGATASSNDTIAAYQKQKTRDFFDYWRSRNVREQRDSSGVFIGYTADPHNDAYVYAPTAADQELFARRGYTAAQIQAYVDERTAQYHAYKTSTYSPTYSYVVTAAESAALAEGSSWTQNELQYAVAGAIFFKTTTDTETRIENPNVKGRNVKLVASGGVGSDNAPVTIDGATQTTLTAAQRTALAAAEVDDVAVDNATRQITVLQRDDVDVNASGSIEIAATSKVYLGSEQDLNIKTVSSGDSIRIKGQANIYSVATGGPANITGGATVLEASSGGIGTSAAPLTTSVTGTLVARGALGVWLDQLSGSLSIEEIFSPGPVSLSAAGPILDARGTRPVAIQGEGGITLVSRGGSIGTQASPLYLSNGVAAELDATSAAGGGIFLTSPVRGLTIDELRSGQAAVIVANGGDLRLKTLLEASGSGAASLTAMGNVSFDSAASLTTQSGAIALIAGSGSAVPANVTMADGATAVSQTGTINVQATGDVVLGKLETGNATASSVTISTGGRVLDGGDAHTDIVANAPGARLTITAPGGIGSATASPASATPNPLEIQVYALDATSAGGAIHLAEQDTLVVGAVSGSGNVALTAGGAISGNSIQSAAGAATVTSSTGLIDLASVAGQNGATVSAQGAVTLGSFTSGSGSIAVTASTDDVSVTSASADQNATFTASAGSIVSGTVTATHGSVTLSANGGVRATSTTAGGSVGITASTGDVQLDTVGAGGNITVAAGSTLSANALNSTGGSITGTTAGGDIVLGTVVADRNATLNAGAGSIVAGTTTATNGSATLTADIDVSATTVNAGGAFTASAGRDVIVTTSATSGGNMFLAADQHLYANTLESTGGDITGTAVTGDVDAIAATAAGTITFTAGGSVRFGTATAGGNLSLTAGGALDAATLTSTGGSITGIADTGSVTLGDATAQVNATFRAGDDIVANSVVANTGNATLKARNDITAALVSAVSGDASLDAVNGSIDVTRIVGDGVLLLAKTEIDGDLLEVGRRLVLITDRVNATVRHTRPAPELQATLVGRNRPVMTSVNLTLESARGVIFDRFWTRDSLLSVPHGSVQLTDAYIGNELRIDNDWPARSANPVSRLLMNNNDPSVQQPALYDVQLYAPTKSFWLYVDDNFVRVNGAHIIRRSPDHDVVSVTTGLDSSVLEAAIDEAVVAGRIAIPGLGILVQPEGNVVSFTGSPVMMDDIEELRQ